MSKYTLKTALCDIKTLERLWNKTQSMVNNNVRKNYVNNPENNQRFKIIDMGCYCIDNEITTDMLKVTAIASKRDDKGTTKVVFMTNDEYRDYELFKKIQSFKA